MALTSRHRWWHLGNGNHKIYIISVSRTCIIRKLGLLAISITLQLKKNSLVLFQSCPELFGKTGSEAIYKVEQCEEREGGRWRDREGKSRTFPIIHQEEIYQTSPRKPIVVKYWCNTRTLVRFGIKMRMEDCKQKCNWVDWLFSIMLTLIPVYWELMCFDIWR